MDSDLSVSEDGGDKQLRRISELDSPTKGLKVSTDPATPSCSSFMDSCNKENVSTSKSEVQKLSLEPLQMKRKKTAGYNLRKSLAWNKAFFTEEGVLDPIELSLMSGTIGNASGAGGLCSIEEKGTPQASSSKRNVASTPLKSIKKNLCKEISATPSKEDKEKSSSKMFATWNGRTSSMSGVCPRPLFSTSLKRPANINIGKSAIKESKLPRFQAPKPGSCSTTTTSKSKMPGASPTQNKKISDPVSTQSKDGLRNSFRNIRNGQKKAKDDSFPPDSSRGSHSRGNADTSTSNLNLSNSSSLLPIRKKGNDSLKAIPDPGVAHRNVCSSQGQNGSARPAVSLPQITSTSVRSMQHSQIQTMKPSGLRMPSPSLGFFRESKASETQSLSQRNSKSTVQKLQKSSGLGPPCSMGGQKINDITSLTNGRDIRTRLECSGVSDFQKGTKPCLDGHAKNNRMKVPSDSKNSKPVSGKNEKQNVNDVEGKVNNDGEEVRTEKFSSQQDKKSWMKDKEPILNARECGQTLEEDDPKVIGSAEGSKGSSSSDLEGYELVPQQSCMTNTMETTVNNSVEVEMTSNSLVPLNDSFPEFGSGNANVCDGEETVSNSPARCMQDIHSLPEEQSDKKSCAFEAGQALGEHNYAVVTECCLSKLFAGESSNHGSQDSTDPDLIGLTCTKVETENSALPTEELHVLSSVENVATNEESGESDLGDSVIHTSKEILSSQSCNNIIHESLRAEEAEEGRVSKVVSSVELNGENTSAVYGFDVQGAQTIAEIDIDMIAGPVLNDDLLLHTAQDPHSAESPNVLDKAPLQPKSASFCNETLNLVASGSSESFNGSIKLNKAHILKNDMSAKEIDMCYDNPNEGSPLVKMSDSDLLEDPQNCGLVYFSRNVEDTNHSKCRSNGSSEELLVGVARSQSLDELYNVLSSPSLYAHHCSPISAERLEQSDKPMQQGTCFVSEDLERDQILGGVPELSDTCGGETVGSTTFKLEPAVGGTDTTIDSFDLNLRVEDRSSNCAENSSLPEDRVLLTNSTSLIDIDSAPQTSIHYISGESATCMGMVDDNQDPSRRSDEDCMLEKNVLGDKVETKTSQTIISHTSELSLELDNAKGFASNESSDEDCMLEQNVLGDKVETKTSQTIISHTSELSLELDNAKGFASNESSDEDCMLEQNVLGDKVETKTSQTIISHTSELSLELDNAKSFAGNESSDEDCLLEQNVLGDQVEAKTSPSNISQTNEVCLALDDAKGFASNESATVSIKRPDDGKKKSSLAILPPRNAVPFSDEWLAAIEAAGEDILTMKGGAVQNSPPDKSMPEPSPWSPVRKKNNQAGPFDCTKFTRNQRVDHTDSHQLN